MLSFYYYSKNIQFNQLSANNKRRKDVYRLSRADAELLHDLRLREKFESVDRAILENAHFLLKIVENPETFGYDIDKEEHESEEAQTKLVERKQKKGNTPSGHGHDLGMSIDKSCVSSSGVHFKLTTSYELLTFRVKGRTLTFPSTWCYQSTQFISTIGGRYGQTSKYTEAVSARLEHRGIHFILPAFFVSWILSFFSFSREGRSAKLAMGPSRKLF